MFTTNFLSNFLANSASRFFIFSHCFHIKTQTLLVNIINSHSLVVFLIITFAIPV